MRFSKKFILAMLFMAVAAGGLFAGGAKETQAAEEPKVTWKLAGVHAVTTPETKGMSFFAEQVKQKTNGKFTVEVFPAGQLGSDEVAMVENLMMGSVDMFANVMDWNQHLVKDFSILAMPFLFKDLDAVKVFQKDQIYRDFSNRMIGEKGVRIITDNWYRLPRVVLANKPLTSLADFQGLNMRMPSLKTYFDTWKALGAKPTVIPWAESFLALQRGVVEGLDSPMGSIYGMKFYQAAPYIIMTYHLVSPFNLLANEKKYQALPEAYKKVIHAAGDAAGDYYTQIVIDMFDVDKKKMEAEGAKFMNIDTAPFVKVMAGVAEQFESEGMWRKGLYKEITNVQ